MSDTLPTNVLEFFNANPDATECFVALGYVLATREAAEKKLAGVKGHMPMRYERGEGVKHEKDSDALLEILIGFEEEEQKAHEAYDLKATDDNMNAWKDAQKNVEKARAEYDRIVADEKKAEGGIVAEGSINSNEGNEVVTPVNDEIHGGDAGNNQGNQTTEE